MRPVFIPLILTLLISFTGANPDYEEGPVQNCFVKINTVFPIILDLFSGEDESAYPDDSPDSLMRMGMVKAGQNLGANVTCKRWTSRLVTVGRSRIKLIILNCDFNKNKYTSKYKIRE